DWPEPLSQVRGDTSLDWIVGMRRLKDIQVMTDGVFHMDERSVVKEARSNGKISQWSGAEFVAIVGVAGNFFQTEIFVLPWAREDDIPFTYSEERSDLGSGDDALLKIREHLVRVTD